MLKRAKYDVQAVPGPKEAIEIVRSVAPQLILMDMNFTLSTSGDEGLTLLKQVKVFRPDVPVILMTAWGSIPVSYTHLGIWIPARKAMKVQPAEALHNE